MSCFSFFKERPKSQRRFSTAPELGRPSEVGSSTSAATAPKRAVRSSGSAPSTRSLPEMFQEKEHKLRVFAYSELKEATDRFDKRLKLGEGGFGSVYKGFIRPADGVGEPFPVAIKKLNMNSSQGHKEWLAEVHFLGIVDHPNLVKLLGYSYAEGERGIQLLLVYEYMPNKSLEDHLFNKALPPLPWKTRLEIVLGVAQGLAYLHEGMEIQVIYRDIKTSNVLLDNNFKPKLSDFGLAREGPSGHNTHVSTRVAGTPGYAAPEYVETGHLTAMSDLYSFGVVLYEALTGRRTIERKLPASQQKLLEWVQQYPADSKKFILIIDPRLGDQYSLAAAREVAKIADSCLHKTAKERPAMSEVAERLKKAIAQPHPHVNRNGSH
uniref:Protein kinase domain-containing protein n=1 Tax=Kalanchoe fedtschenkoi TaxID=63787 RepID=A0A7N0VGD1_KALFE